jgi:peptidoglycan/LPS O-acetylase OafA/YrhL
MRYRPDVDGLRAIAIATVVLFHLGVKAVPGGFIGVDIFFVISGFLITGLIVEQLKAGRFSFWDFYARRTRRIFPALFVMMPLTLIVGWFVLTPGEYVNLGKSAAYSAAFLANVYFWLNTGYFDQTASTMPLLHLWSIGVEEQFYLIWPLSLVLVWRFVRLGQKATLLALIASTVLLALVCIIWTAVDAKSAFFLPFTRLWEFTLGALALALPEVRHTRLANALSVLGVGAMLASAFTFNEHLAYPGAYAILPCVGAATAIAAGERSLMGRLLSLQPAVLLGKLSYSLYLWHWPILVYCTYYYGELKLHLPHKVGIVLAALGISYISWRFVEQPIRHRRGLPWRHVAVGGAAAAVTACLALVVVTQQGFPTRIPESVRPLGDQAAMEALACTEILAMGFHNLECCVVGVPWKNASKRAILWGDSHARHLLPLLDVVAREQDMSVLYWSGCPPFIGDSSLKRSKLRNPRYFEDCSRTQRELLDYVAKTPEIDLVIIADAWAIYPATFFGKKNKDTSLAEKSLKLIEQGLVDIVDNIDPKQHRVLFVGDVPRPGFFVADCALQSVAKLWRKKCRRWSANFTNPERPVETILKRITESSDGVFYIDSMKAMCSEDEGCPIQIGNEIIYRDGNHFRHDLSLATREKLVTMLGLRDVLKEAANDTSSAAHTEGPGTPAQ